MASRIVDIYYGTNFTRKLSLNSVVDGAFAFRSKTVDLLGGPEQEVIMGETEYSVPYDIRAKLQPRAFSIIVSVQESASVYDNTWHRRRLELLKVLYSGVLRIGVERRGWPNYVYIEARVEGVKETEPGVFECAMLAPDPVFTQYDPNLNELPDGSQVLPGEPPLSEYMTVFEQDQTESGNPSESDATAEYNPAVYTPYRGSAPTEPVVIFEVMGSGRVWRYRKEFSVKNKSTMAFHNQMVCVDLGEVLGAGDPLNGKVNGNLSDLRIETFGGARKPIYARRHDNAGAQGTGDFLKVWFVIHSLQPGETKKFRLLYGNVNAPIETENASVKMMFNGYSSTNSIWKYGDFQPRWDQPQSRLHQWVPHLQSRENITWIAYPHPDFASTDPLLVNVAGGKAVYHGRSNGYAGLELATTVPIASIEYEVKTRTTWKAPFVQRSLRSDGRWVDDYYNATTTGHRSYAKFSANAGATQITLTDVYGGAYTWYSSPADNVRIVLDNGSNHDTTVTAVDSNGGYVRLTLAAAIPLGRSVAVGAYVWQNVSGRELSSARTQTFASGEEPRAVMLGMRIDAPSLDIGEWYYAASANCNVTFKSAEVPEVRWRTTATEDPFTGTTFVSGHEFDMDTAGAVKGYQLVGRIQNDNDSTGIRVNTVLEQGVRDRLVVDCEKRTCSYYKYNPTTYTYEAGENRYEALYFEEVRDYWIKMVPEQESAAVRFVHDNQSNFRNIRAIVRWRNRYF